MRLTRLLLALGLLSPCLHAANEAKAPVLNPGVLAPIAARPQVPALPPTLTPGIEVPGAGLSAPSVAAVETGAETAPAKLPELPGPQAQGTAPLAGLAALESLGGAGPPRDSAPTDLAPGAADGEFDGARRPAGDEAAVDLTPAQFARQSLSRFKLLAQRAATFPAHVWPFTSLAKKISHGEGLAGLTPASAVRAAEQIQSQHGAGAVIGRLSWELHDLWSVRAAARSYARLIDAAGLAKSKDPKLDVAVSLDVEALGGQLDGLTLAERTRIAKANAVALARRARGLGVSVEFDIGASALMPLLLGVSRAVVRELGMPVRLALAARYLACEAALRDWAALARETGLKLGVRLVKGSFIEGDQPGTLYLRRELLHQYKKIITQALGQGEALDVAVATQNEEIWNHAQAESRRIKTGFSLQTIRGVNAGVQAGMRASGNVPREYVSYGIDTPVMALMEWWTNWRQRRALRRRLYGKGEGELD